MCLSSDITILQIELKEILYKGKFFLVTFIRVIPEVFFMSLLYHSKNNMTFKIIIRSKSNSNF
jgi:ABC-type arginine transport system permease subunit